MDALDHQAFEELLDGGVPVAEARMQARARGMDIFKTNYLQRLKEVKHKPRSVVWLRGLLLLVSDTSIPLSHSPLRHEQRRS
jgi:hypothetical protein